MNTVSLNNSDIDDSLRSRVESIRIADFDYELPDERIARHPLARRDGCKLMLSRPDGIVAERVFSDLPGLLPPSSLLVCNNTRVINARISFFKSTGSRIEVFLLEPLDPRDYVLSFQTSGRCVWSCLVGNAKRWKDGRLVKDLILSDGRNVRLEVERGRQLEGGSFEVTFVWNDPSVTFASVVEVAGNIPIPPYLKRESEESDSDDYQTVYSEVQGSVAAPTAGLHFTDSLFDDLAGHNIRTARLTLHVGAGTFQPVKSERIGDHPMHTETFTVERSLVASILEARRLGRRIIAVGTTTVRTLESLPFLLSSDMNVGQWDAYAQDACGFDTDLELQRLLDYMDSNSLGSLTGATSIMIAPGFRWRIVEGMVTNFHQPQSTLLLLVSSFLEQNTDYFSLVDSGCPLQWRLVYSRAMESDFRFLSYGDACLLYPRSRE